MNSGYEKFLLEHYTQVNEHLREADRKRDILLGSYFSLSIAGLGFCLSVSQAEQYRIGILAFLICIGVIVSIIVTKFRGWHAEYANVAMAIHKCFLDGDDGNFDLLKAAKDVKSQNKYHFFFRTGVEFWMMVLTLLFLSAEAGLLVWWVCDSQKFWLKLLLTIVIILLICGVGIWRYKVYLVKREDEFPENSVYILQRAGKSTNLPNKNLKHRGV